MATRSTTPPERTPQKIQRRNQKNKHGAKIPAPKDSEPKKNKKTPSASKSASASRAKSSAASAKTKPETPQKKLTPTDVEFYCYFAYLGPFWFIGLLSGSKNKTLFFHLNQGIVLFITEILAAVICFFGGELLSLIPLMGGIIAFLLRLGVIVTACIMSVYGMIGVSKGEKRRLPIIGTFKVLK